MSDFGHSCSPTNDCTLPNLHCAYPDCAKGRREGVHSYIAKPPASDTDIVKWLRVEYHNRGQMGHSAAADLIERLQAEKAEMEQVIRELIDSGSMAIRVKYDYGAFIAAVNKAGTLINDPARAAMEKP